MLVVQLEKKEAMREEEEKKRKALKRRTLKDQVNKSSSICIPNLTLPIARGLRRLSFREATVEAEAGAPRVAAAAEARAARVGAKEAETRVAAAAKATGANRGAKGTTMEAEAAAGRKAASQRHRVVRVLSYLYI